MLIPVLILNVICLLGVQSYNKNGNQDVRSPFSHEYEWNFRLPDLFGTESRRQVSENRDIEGTPGRDREPLSPDYVEPGKKPKDDAPKPPNKPQPPPYNPPGGVVDVDANDFGFSSNFPHIADTFGFSSSFGDPQSGEGGGGLFGFSGIFGPFADHTPWWKGDNVCIDREESTDDEDIEDATKQNNTDVPNFFSTSISLSNCKNTPSKYECVTKINNHGVVKTFIVRYKCCYGYSRADNGVGGCTKKLQLLSLLKTIEDVGGKEFRQLIQATNLDDRFTGENLTVLVPTDVALSDFNDKMTELNQVAAVRRRRQVKNPVTSTNLVLNHIISGFEDITELVNEEVLYSENNNSIRFNTYPTKTFGKMLTANCAPVHTNGHPATNGIVHVIDGVLNPVEQTVIEIIAEHPQLQNLHKALQSSALIKDFDSNGHYTIFAPTDEAFNKLAPSSKDKLLVGGSCASTILKHHIVAHTICSCAVIGNVTTHSVDGEILGLQRNDDGMIRFEDTANIVQSDIVGTNGVVHVIDVVVIPDSALYVSQALKSEKLIKFQNLIDAAGLAEEIDSLKNVTVFAPSDEAFSHPDAIKLLDSIQNDTDKLKELVLSHTIQGQLESCNMNNNDVLKTNGDGKELRINLYSTVPVFVNIINRATINCVRITGYDEKSCDSIIHEINGLLVPPTENLLDSLKNDPSYSVFNEILSGTDVEVILKDNSNALTVLVPSNEAFAKLSDVELKNLKENKRKANDFLKNHILTEVLCCSGVGPQTWGFNSIVPTLSFRTQSVGRIGNQIHIGATTVTRCDKTATNGVIHTINKILYPQQQSRNPSGDLGYFLLNL